MSIDERNDAEQIAKRVFDVEVRTPDGARTTLKARAEETVGNLKQRAIEKLDVQPAPGVVLYLFLGGTRLADGVTLGSVGVKEGTVLILASEPQVGASTR